MVIFRSRETEGGLHAKARNFSLPIACKGFLQKGIRDTDKW